jgi:hypothetical protein
MVMSLWRDLGNSCSLEVGNFGDVSDIGDEYADGVACFMCVALALLAY